jgi:hypothetical protein
VVIQVGAVVLLGFHSLRSGAQTHGSTTHTVTDYLARLEEPDADPGHPAFAQGEAAVHAGWRTRDPQLELRPG